MVFANPNYLYLLLLLIPMIGWYVYKLSKSQASLQVSSSEAFEAPGATSWIVYLRHVPFVLRMVAVALLIVILARPQSTNSWSNSSTEGIDIMLAMDISGSMLAQDLKPNRLEAAKDVAASFINGRPNDNIGLVVFSAESFTQCPLTTDHTVLLNLFKDIQSGMIQDGTAIGLGLANAVSRIKDSHAKSKVIILLTDGSNNAGEIAPVTAAEIAKRGVPGCIISGPLALDGAISMESVKHKAIHDPVAGQADILLVPFIEIGNVLYKACTYIAGKTMASTICGASCPVIITSRADTPDSKYYSILLAVLRCLKA